MQNNYGRLKAACYMANISMAIVGNLPPVLFLTFHNLYDVSYTLLGLLVLINFCTQLSVDLLFSFFSYKINTKVALRIMPALTVAGLLVYALSPLLFQGSIYTGLVIGTVIFSASGGFAEVLISPIIAAIPSKTPERDMSKLHSVYAWGVVGVIIVSTIYLVAFKPEMWTWLAVIFSAIPLISFIMLLGCELPPLDTPKKASGIISMLKNRSLWLCIFAIFLGGATECTMAQWSSGYLEGALGIPKVWGDIFGVALFAVFLGLGRTLYAKFGGSIERVLLFGSVGAVICYLVAAVTPFPILGLFACALTGFCASMLWPGSLLVVQNRIPTGGVFIFAMMASGGDLGASVAPQLIGIITDKVSASVPCIEFAESLSLSSEQLGMKIGMLIGMLFPLVGIFVFSYILKTKKSKQ